jgi:hypothetical protein
MTCAKCGKNITFKQIAIYAAKAPRSYTTIIPQKEWHIRCAPPELLKQLGLKPPKKVKRKP